MGGMACSKPWQAEVLVTPELARDLIEQQFDRLAPVGLEQFGAGWDNTAYLVNRSYVFRFPRRRVALQALKSENELLPVLAARLPLSVPVPIFVGQPTMPYPWIFSGYKLLPGRTACEAHPTDAQRVGIAESLAELLVELHGIRADEARRLGAIPDVIGRLDAGKLQAKARQNLATISGSGLITEVSPWLRVLDSLEVVPAPRRVCLVHGDLYARHLLVDRDNSLSGIIDWGDLHLGDPAVDLSVVFGFFPPAARSAFWSIYGPVEGDVLKLARLRAIHHSAAVVAYAYDIADPDLLDEGMTALDNALS
jgi:aminoglycoside phosphotransferase (APT) family kinase protein